MAGRDLQDIKEEVRSRIDIVEVISAYTRLKPEGKTFKGLCPFHADKKPSFSVAPAFQSYRCWSCGVKGDVFNFIQEKENVTFIEALELLAKRAGVPFERSGMSTERVSEREEMHALNSVAVRFFQDRFAKSEIALEYINKRAILKETQDRFDIGYAPSDWDALAGYLVRQRANMQLAVKIGLVRPRKDSDGFVDYYRNRLMFPIHDLTGNVVGFGGRAMGDEQPKYVNSPQSDIFNKSRLLYGLYFARQKLTSDIPPVFVEGYMDVVTAHQAGFTQCVATLGTAMTEEHARTLVRYNRKVVLCYDADSAGINATLKGASVWDSMGVDGAKLLVARLPAGEDPDSVLKRGDIAIFQTAIDKAIPRVDFEIELVMSRHDVTQEDGRDLALREIIPILSTVSTRSTLDKYVQKISHLHPMYHFNVARALESILADIQTYKQHNRDGNSARNRGYDTVQNQNGGPLNEQPPPPQYLPGSQRQGGFNPNTTNWQKSGGRTGENGGNANRRGRFDDPKPPSDRRPPDLSLPSLSAAEKAERTLLRAMFSVTWRNQILNRVDESYFTDPLSKQTLSWMLRAPRDAEGNIEPLTMIRFIEKETASTRSESDEAADLHAAEAEFPLLYPSEGQDISISSNQFAKLSDYIRDVLEDSESILSNEPLSEPTINGCIRRLQDRRESMAIRDVKAELDRSDLTLQQRRDLMEQLMKLTRAQRGTSTGGL